MKKLLSLLALGLSLSLGSAYAADQASCEKSAADKKLAGAAKTSHVKKCMEGDAMAGGQAACEKSATDKKLAGAAKNSHVKKCMEDAKPAAATKVEAKADAKPAAAKDAKDTAKK